MRNFSGNVLATQAAVRTIESEARAAEVEFQQAWLTGLTDGEVKRIFRKLSKAFNKVKKSSGWFMNMVDGSAWAHFEEVGLKLRRIRRVWLSVDRQKLSDQDAAFMYESITKILPDLVGVYRRNANLFNGRAAILGGYDNSLYPNKVPHQQTVSYTLGSLFVSLDDIQQDQWSASYAAAVVKPVQRPVLLAPQVPVGDAVLVDAVEGLSGLWLEARSRQLGEVDRFFVDEVAGRYFPDAWRMLQGFEGGDEQLWGEARAVFLEQVGLMSRKLRQVGAVPGGQASLEELEAHSVFLREVTA